MKVNIVQKASAQVLDADGKPRFSCGRCSKPIMPGDSYKWAKGRFTTRRVCCAEHNFRQSELTGSDKLQRLYEAQENIEDAVSLFLNSNTEDIDGLKEALEQAQTDAEEVGQEYRDAAEAMGAAGAENEAKADQCDEWAQELEQAAGELENFGDTDEGAPVMGERSVEDRAAAFDEWQDEMKNTAENTIGALQL